MKYSQKELLLAFFGFGAKHIRFFSEIPKVIRTNNRKINIPLINKPNNDGTLTKKQ